MTYSSKPKYPITCTFFGRVSLFDTWRCKWRLHHLTVKCVDRAVQTFLRHPQIILGLCADDLVIWRIKHITKHATCGKNLRNNETRLHATVDRRRAQMSHTWTIFTSTGVGRKACTYAPDHQLIARTRGEARSHFPPEIIQFLEEHIIPQALREWRILTFCCSWSSRFLNCSIQTWRRASSLACFSTFMQPTAQLRATLSGGLHVY